MVHIPWEKRKTKQLYSSYLEEVLILLKYLVAKTKRNGKIVYLYNNNLPKLLHRGVCVCILMQKYAQMD